MTPASRPRVTVVRVAAVVCVCVGLAAACGPGPAGPPHGSESASMALPLDRATLPLVSLPDLSMISASAQEQLRAEYAVLLATMDDPGATDMVLGNAYGEVGKLLLTAGYRYAAEASFLNGQALASDEIRWPYYLGHLHQMHGEGEESVAYFSRALQLRPDDVAVLLRLGQATLDRGLPADAERSFTRALSLQPRSVSALFGLGRVALLRQDYAPAVHYLEQALAIDATAGPIHYSLGMAYRGLGDLAQAETHLRRGTSGKMQVSDPFMEEIDALLETATAHELRGGRALEKGDISAAAGHFRKAVELAPDEPAFHHKLATALALSGDSNGALQRLEDVVERWPTFAKAHHSIGLILLTLGRHGDAIHRFTSAVTIDPMDIAARLRLAEVLRASGRFEASLFHYEQVTEHDPRVADAGFGHAMALVGLMRYRGARDDLDLAMSVFPDRDGFSHAAARLLAAAPDDQVRDGRRALAIVKALVGARETSIPLAETMAMALAEVGQYGEAVRWQQDAIDTATKTGFTYLLPRLIGNLRLYEHGQPCRTPWGDEVAVATL